MSVFGIWSDFIEYAIVGISTFSNKIPYSVLFESRNIYVKVLSRIFIFQIILMFSIYIISFIKKELEKKEWFKNLSMLLIFAVATAPVIFPISDDVHFAIGSLVVTISFVYLVYQIINLIVFKKLFRKISYTREITTIEKYNENIYKNVFRSNIFCIYL